ncbi:MAG: NAD(P)/FAD-dependent oxidoreductase, partial [Kangiella sp.]|nr:NAD(P)/FAD-dependent oxidoreductase [Kangiella sp.]
QFGIVRHHSINTIDQRSAQWARPIPRYHDPISEEGQWLLKEVPFYAAWFRFTMFWRYGDGLLPTLHKDPDWPHPERSLNKANDRHRQQMTDHIVSSLKDRPDLIDKCLPTYPPYGKRILLDNGWYEALLKPNVELVTEPIDHIDEEGIETDDGMHRGADIIVLATGFDVGAMAARLNITGKGGQSLSELWADDSATAYLGITVPGFPNLFCTQGPNTGLGHGGSAIFQAECQAHYIADCVAHMLQNDLSELDVTPAAHDAYVARVDAEHEKMIWTHPGMSTYYRNAAGRVFSVMPWRLVDYWHMTRHPKPDDYRRAKAAGQ